MVRRLKSDLPPRWDGSARFAKRRLEAIPVPYTAEEREAHSKLREYTALRGKGAIDGTEKYATEFVLKLLKKRLFSSPAAFATTLEKHEDSVNSARRRGRLPAAPKPTEGLLRRQLTQQLEEDYADDDVYEEATTDALASATRLFRELSGEESRLLRELRRWAVRSASRPDSKAAELLCWLRTHIKPGGKWVDERVLIFTEYRATQNWLHQLLITEGVADGERLMTLYGGMDALERERVKAAFQACGYFWQLTPPRKDSIFRITVRA
jgi:hypothetical protein